MTVGLDSAPVLLLAYTWLCDPQSVTWSCVRSFCRSSRPIGFVGEKYASAVFVRCPSSTQLLVVIEPFPSPNDIFLYSFGSIFLAFAFFSISLG